MSFKGLKNVYRCAKCGHSNVTVDRDEGTTPFKTGCTKEGCDGIATSMLYKVLEPLHATHEWYRITDLKDPILRHPASRWHHQQGGLFLRKIKPDLKIIS
jgi:hypothetical protein